MQPHLMQPHLMQVDEMNMGCGLGTWGHNSHCVLATADDPGGPYTKTAVLVNSWCHGSSPGHDVVSVRRPRDRIWGGGLWVGRCFEQLSVVHCDSPPSTPPPGLIIWIS